MDKKPAPKTKLKSDDPEQSKRFIETAREIGTDETGKEFEKAIKRIVPPKRSAISQN